MNRMRPEGMNYYDQAVSGMIAEKYGLSPMDALRAFTASQTHELLQDRENGLSAFGAEGIFDIWESERVTGNPRNSIYIRGE